MTYYSDLFNQFNDLNVLIVGDVMIDRYLRGSVNRISPEAPVPVVHLQSTDNRLGGAANVALNIKAMGANPLLCTMIGSDKDSQTLLSLLPKEAISASGILTSEERITTVKTRVMAGAQHLLRIDEEQTNPLSETDSKRLLAQFSKMIGQQKIDVVLLQDYNKGVLHANNIQAIISMANQHQIPIVVDPKFHHFFSYDSVDLFKPNLKEVNEALPFEVTSKLSSLEKAANYLRKKLNNKYTLITLSEKGIFLNIEGESLIIPTQPRQIADVCGAGDTVISMAALGLGAQLDIKEIAILSNLAGGQVCEKVGVVSVDKKQLEEEYVRLLANRSI